jgi:alginate O-acetyltransferase complex protein AlgI
MPSLVGLLGRRWPAWVLMWSLAVAIYAGLKWLTFAHCGAAGRWTWGHRLGYLLLWPGMDAAAFFASNRQVPRPVVGEWLGAAGKTLLGLVLIFGSVRVAMPWSRLLGGWLGMIGIVFALHFGLFHLLSVGWRRAGIDARAIMNHPVAAHSLSDFWGRRWNLAFRDVAHEYVFRPAARRWGIAGGTLAVFIVSGVVHDLVMSIPAAGGLGLPTMYFCIQGLGLFLERTRVGKALGLGQGWIGWFFAGLVTVLPMGLLFHPPFVHRVIVPTLAALGATG